jgi:hypothetical protein
VNSASAIGAETNVVEGPPELGVAVVVNGRLELYRFVERMETRRTTNPLFIEMVPIVETRIIRVDATAIAALRVDGRTVSADDLVAELVNPAPVFLVQQGQRIDPLWFSKILLLCTSSADAGVYLEMNDVEGVPELCIAVVADGRLELRKFAIRPTTSTRAVPGVGTGGMRVDIAAIAVRRIDGRSVSAEDILVELAKPAPVMLVKQEQKVDPSLFSGMLVLQLPTLSTAIPDRFPAYHAPDSGTVPNSITPVRRP